jgi:hypothetical protein
MLTKNFLLGGRAVFTVSNPQEVRYTYKIKYNKEKNVYFVSVLRLQDNTSDYSYLGLLHPLKGSIIITANSKYNSMSLPFKVAQWAVKMIYNEKSLPEGYKIHHEGHCARCGKPLIVPKSIESGFGPKCMKKVD